MVDKERESTLPIRLWGSVTHTLIQDSGDIMVVLYVSLAHMAETWKHFVISALRENILGCKVGFGTFTRSNAEKENERKLCCSSYAEIHNHRSVL